MKPKTKEAFAKRRRPDIVLMDINKFIMDGIKATRKIRKCPRNNCK